MWDTPEQPDPPVLGLDAGQPVVRSSQHAVEGAGGDGAGRVGCVRPLRVPKAPVSPGTSPPDGKGKCMHAAGAGVFAGSGLGVSTYPVSSSFPQRQTSSSQLLMVPARIKFCVCTWLCVETVCVACCLLFIRSEIRKAVCRCTVGA